MRHEERMVSLARYSIVPGEIHDMMHQAEEILPPEMLRDLQHAVI